MANPNEAPFTNYLFENAVVGGDENIIYIGEAKLGVATDDERWVVFKFDYDNSGNLIQIRSKGAVAWDDRASLDW